MGDFVYVRQMAEDNKLELLAGSSGLDAKIYEDMISRPGLEFAGYFDYFDNKRLLLVGSKDASFLHLQGPQKILENVENIFKRKPPCIVFSKNVIINPIFYDMAEKYGICIFRANLRTTQISSKLYTYLQDKVAERISVHGTLLDINGMGTLIIGKSGVGKSETALDLIKMGHQLIADDLVEIYQKEPGILSGASPEILKRYMEIRGIGVVDVVTMFGAGAFREKKMIRLVVELESWNNDKYYDRLGIETTTIKYFDTELVKLTIPVLPGRSVALLVESAAMNEKLKLLGHHAALEFVQKVDEKAKRGGNEE